MLMSKEFCVLFVQFHLEWPKFKKLTHFYYWWFKNVKFWARCITDCSGQYLFHLISKHTPFLNGFLLHKWHRIFHFFNKFINICAVNEHLWKIRAKYTLQQMKISHLLFNSRLKYATPYALKMMSLHNTLTYLLFYSFNPSTWGHSPKDIEHVKNSCNIYIRQNIYSTWKRKRIKKFT